MKRFTQLLVLLFALAAAAGTYWYINNALSENTGGKELSRGSGGPGGPRPGGPSGGQNGGPPGAPSNTIKKNQSNRGNNNQEAEEALMISVISVSSSTYSPVIKSTGVVTPRYSLTLTSKVSGEVVSISEKLEAGRQVKADEPLAKLKNITLDTAVAEARKTLASAELALKEEKRLGEQASAEWKAAGFEGEPDSDLVLRKPQLADAKATVEAAKVALKEARDNLQHTTIKAPFDALVVSRFVTPGANISTNGELATFYSTDRAEIALNLSSVDWQKLPPIETLLTDNWPVQITSVDTSNSWQGKVFSANLHIDTTTRMRSMKVGLDNPLSQQPPLLMGSFVSVMINGRPISNLWKLPITALSQQSEIWFLDDDSRLDSFEATPLFTDAEHIYISVPNGFQDKAYNVLVKPYSSYLKGTLAKPAEVTE